MRIPLSSKVPGASQCPLPLDGTVSAGAADLVPSAWLSTLVFSPPALGGAVCDITLVGVVVGAMTAGAAGITPPSHANVVIQTVSAVTSPVAAPPEASVMAVVAEGDKFIEASLLPVCDIFSAEESTFTADRLRLDRRTQVTRKTEVV